MTETVVVPAQEGVRIFAILDGAVFYLQEGEDDLLVKLPSITEANGYKTPIAIDLEKTDLEADDITAIYIMRVSAMYLSLGFAALLTAVHLF